MLSDCYPARIEGFLEVLVRVRRTSARGVDSLGQLWQKGRLPPEQSSRLLIVLTQLRDLHRRHIATEDNEVFPVHRHRHGTASAHMIATCSRFAA
jgi:hemerythrin-like domain-containing protein